jgi:hypothetical protein
MPHAESIETVLSASRIDVDDQLNVTAACELHAIAEPTLRAMIDVFRPLTDSFEVYVTR